MNTNTTKRNKSRKRRICVDCIKKDKEIYDLKDYVADLEFEITELRNEIITLDDR